MIRIKGIEISEHKKIQYALQKIYGIGPTRSKIIINKLKLNEKKKFGNLKEEDINNISKIIDILKFKIEGDLKREESLNIKRLKDIKCYRGVRHIKNLPVRGQRTKTNAKTKKKYINKK
jgi:small subunit ribosomal protein S13